MHELPLASLEARLRRELEGEVLFDAFARGRYSTDASIYQIEPLGVVVPRTVEDAQRALEIAADAGVPAAAARRGHVAMRPDRRRRARDRQQQAPQRDCSSSMPRRRTAWVEPGIVLDDLNARLKPHGLWYPVDVSTSAQATIGGMTANNSCGARSMRYGNMVHNVLAAETWLSSGETVTFGAVGANGSEGPSQGSATAARRHRELVATVRALHARERDEIAARVPQVQRRVAGYNLDMASDGAFNMAQPAGRLRGHARLLPQDQAQAVAAADAKSARHRALPDVLSGNGSHAAHREARAQRSRARRPHDDRAVARNRDIPRDGRQDDPRRARRDPAGRVRGRRARRRKSRSSSSSRSSWETSGCPAAWSRSRTRSCSATSGRSARPGSTS